RRNKVAMAAAATVVMVLVLGILGTSWQAIRATRSRDEAEKAKENAKSAATRAEEEKNTARQNAYAASMLLAQADWDNNNIPHLKQILAQTQNYPDRGFEWYYWQRQCHSELRTIYGHLEAVTSVAIS